MRLPRWLFITLNIYALMLAVIMIWPFLQILVTSVTSDVTFPPHNFSILAWSNVLWPDYFKSMLVSLRMGLFATIIVIAMCLPAAYAIERRRFPGRSALGALIFVPAIFPTITYGIAIGVYLALYAIQWQGAFPLVVLATATWTIPLVVRVIQGSVATTDVVYEEAALVMGASPVNTFFRVTLPLIAPGVITAGAIAFTSAATNFTVPWLMGSTEQPVAIFIYQDVGKLGFTPQTAVEVLVMQLIVLGIVQFLFLVFRKQFRGAFA
ncbi:MAG TPA: ABC transporter permease subunit [Phototrophicaceae bacterium]|nr:ABC transporter permease subunit [Phototrophicaceae bacterium]